MLGGIGNIGGASVVLPYVDQARRIGDEARDDATLEILRLTADDRSGSVAPCRDRCDAFAAVVRAGHRQSTPVQRRQDGAVMCFADRGFVFLSMPKAGSTVLQKHFARHAMILFRQPPGMKHMSAVTFEAVLAPWLERYGHPRDSYETMCLVRHPLDRAVSWWKYRARPEAQGQPNYTGDLSFAEFADRLVGGEVPLGTSSNFVTDADDPVIVDRMYRYEHLDAATAWMSERLGIARADARADQRLSGPRGRDGRRHPGPARGALRPGPRHLRERHLRGLDRGSRIARTARRSGSRGLPTYDGGHESGLPTGHPGAPCPGRPAGDPGPRAGSVRSTAASSAWTSSSSISGFLITGLLVSEAERTGRVSLLGLLRPPGPPDPARGDRW